MSHFSMSEPPFFRKAYHNMRNPLVVIKGYTALMLDGCGGDVTDEQREWVEDMKRNADFLLDVINGLSELSSLEAGIHHETPAPVDLRNVVELVVDGQRTRAQEKSIALETKLPDQPVEVTVDEALAHKAVAALVKNAVTFTGEGGSVQVMLTRTDDAALVVVKDTGCGIAPEQLPRIFEGFYRGDEGVPGAGLGLVIARAVAEHFGGKMGVESRPGEGSEFTLTLPYPF